MVEISVMKQVQMHLPLLHQLLAVLPEAVQEVQVVMAEPEAVESIMAQAFLVQEVVAADGSAMVPTVLLTPISAVEGLTL